MMDHRIAPETALATGSRARPVEPPELAVVLVSYNTRALTLKCLETLYAETRATPFETILWDNASHDGSAEAVEARFPQVRVIRSPDNLGFARANNEAAKLTEAEWILLLNTDTEVQDRAIDRLLAFARAHPQGGIYGGRTVFPDGSLNIASCWRRVTVWSAFCRAFWLTKLAPNSELFNPEAMGGWRRDTVREVDIVVGCLLLIRRALWRELDGFDTRFWMYGEEADLCLRARDRGYRPLITPEAQIMHLVGASSRRADKQILSLTAASTLIRKHWSAASRPVGLALLWLSVFNRRLVSGLASAMSGGRGREAAEDWRRVWRARRDWLAGYREGAEPRR